MSTDASSTLEEMVLGLEAVIEARKRNPERSWLVMLDTLRDTLNADPLIMELGKAVDAYCDETPTLGSIIHPSNPHNPVRGYAQTLLHIHAKFVQMPKRWYNEEVVEEYVSPLYHTWFHYVEQSARVMREWGLADPSANSRRMVWFEDELLWNEDDDMWLYYTKMCRHTFLSVSNRLQMLSWTEGYSSRPLVPVPAQLGATLYYLVHGADFETVSEKFGINIDAVKEILEKCLDRLQLKMAEYLKWPRLRAQTRVVSGFKEHWLLDDCRGVLGTTRFTVIPPDGSATRVIGLQAVCDHTGTFLSVSFDRSGNLSDSEILERSSIYNRASRGLILKPRKRVSGGGEVIIEPYLLASQDHKPFPWLLLANDEADDEDSQEFYCRVNLAMYSIHLAFEDMMKDFQVLGAALECSFDEAEVLLRVCCILHNFLYMKEDRRVRPSPRQLLNPLYDSSFDSDTDSE